MHLLPGVMTMVPIKTNLANRKNYGGSRLASQIKYIVMHYTANDGDHDEGNAIYFANNVVGASAHYFVDDDSITLSVPELSVAWAVGGSKWSDCPKTGGGTMYGIVTNINSLSIEMCDTVKDGKLMATDKTMQNSAELAKMLMKKYNIPIENVYRHFDINGKHCPSYLMDKAEWATFKERLKEKEESTVEIYNKIEEVPDWAKPTVKKLVSHGTLNGDTNGNLSLDTNLLRMLVINDREGCYGK